MANRIHSAAYYFYMARRVRGAYASDCMQLSWYQLFVDAAGVMAGAQPPSFEQLEAATPEDMAIYNRIADDYERDRARGVGGTDGR